MDNVYYYYGQVSCIDRQIAELEARRDALMHGYCYTGYHEVEPFVDPYNLAVEVVEKKDEDKRQ